LMTVLPVLVAAVVTEGVETFWGLVVLAMGVSPLDVKARNTRGIRAISLYS
jgi:hypothetical protein